MQNVSLLNRPDMAQDASTQMQASRFKVGEYILMCAHLLCHLHPVTCCATYILSPAGRTPMSSRTCGLLITRLKVREQQQWHVSMGLLGEGQDRQ
jgi:hypothetical protein